MDGPSLQQRPFRRLNRLSLTGPKVWVEREKRRRGAQQFSFFEKWNFRRGIRVGYYVTAALAIRSVAAEKEERREETPPLGNDSFIKFILRYLGNYLGKEFG